MSQHLKEFSNQHLAQLEETMFSFLMASTNEENLRQSMHYSLAAGGKRLRPLLVLATLEFANIPIGRGHYQVAGALEMLHTYSLIHDDLPAMDNDVLRRGLPTNHIKFGEALAILAGDGLLTGAFQLVSQADLPSEIRLKLVEMLALGAGNTGMIAGQVADMEAEGQRIDLDSLASIHQRKTGALIEFAVKAGSLMGGVPAEVADALNDYARHFGIAFQIKDDLLDVLGDEAVMGKKTGMDVANDKSTYTSLLGVEGAQVALENELSLAEAALKRAATILNKELQAPLLSQLLDTLRA